MTDVTESTDSASLEREALHRASMRVLVCSQVVGGAGLAAGVTVGALLAEDMLGSTSLSGLPAALFTLGSAAAALLVGWVSQRSGRRPGLALGYAAGAVGGAGVALAAVVDNTVLLLVAMFVYGSGTATNLQARYAGADLAPPDRRGAAISTVLVATTLGAVAAPNLVQPTGRLSEQVGIPALGGPFILAAIAYALAGLVLMVWLRPDPLMTSRALAQADADAAAVLDTAHRTPVPAPRPASPPAPEPRRWFPPPRRRRSPRSQSADLTPRRPMSTTSAGSGSAQPPWSSRRS